MSSVPTITRDVVAIPLTRGYVAIVDAADAERVGRHSWCANIRGSLVYAAARINDKLVYLHRFLTDAPAGVPVDHVDGDGLNNQRTNLRVCTPAQNAGNWHHVKGRSRYRGVFANGYGWCAQIRVNGGVKHLGVFDTEEIAALAYDLAAVDTRGEFARLNIGVGPETAALVERSRRSKAREACSTGHPYAEFGTISSDGGLSCRECNRLKTRERRSTETPAQRAHRLATGRAYNRARRLVADQVRAATMPERVRIAQTSRGLRVNSEMGVEYIRADLVPGREAS
jgi:hypothetical protein